MATEYEDVGRTHELFDAPVRDAPKQAHPWGQQRIARDLPLHRRQQRCGAVATPQAQLRQAPGRLADSGEHGLRVLVAIEMADPQQTRITVETGRGACRGLIAGGEATGAFGNLEDLRVLAEQACPTEWFRLRARRERYGFNRREGQSPGPPPPWTRRAIGVILQQYGQARRER